VWTAASVGMDVLNAHALFATATQLRHGHQLNREGPQTRIGHIPVGLELRILLGML
jgi:hypothetical protein